MSTLEPIGPADKGESVFMDWPGTTSTGTTVLDGITTKLEERSRTYLFDNRNIELTDVIELTVRPSGTHRLKTQDGNLHIINTGWLAIRIETKEGEWTV